MHIHHWAWNAQGWSANAVFSELLRFLRRFLLRQMWMDVFVFCSGPRLSHPTCCTTVHTLFYFRYSAQMLTISLKIWTIGHLMAEAILLKLTYSYLPKASIRFMYHRFSLQSFAVFSHSEPPRCAFRSLFRKQTEVKVSWLFDIWSCGTNSGELK